MVLEVKNNLTVGEENAKEPFIPFHPSTPAREVD